MKERPILFSGPMVRAILDGRKTQTRRFYTVATLPDGLKSYQQEELKLIDGVVHGRRADSQTWNVMVGGKGPRGEGNPERCPYGQPGDRLWVRETYSEQHPAAIPEGRYSIDGMAGIPGPPGVTYRCVYRADGEPLQIWRTADYPYYSTNGPKDDIDTKYPTVTSNFSRGGKAIHWTPSIFMPRWASRITLEVTGVRVERLREIGTNDCYEEGIERPAGPLLGSVVTERDNARNAYRKLWDSINAKRAPWSSNPWVWAVEFKKL